MKKIIISFISFGFLLTSSAWGQQASDSNKERATYFDEDVLEDALICFKKREECLEDLYKSMNKTIGDEVLSQVKLVSQKKHPASHRRCDEITKKNRKLLSKNTFEKFKDKHFWIDQEDLHKRVFYRFYACSFLDHLKSCASCQRATKADQSCSVTNSWYDFESVGNVKFYIKREQEAFLTLCGAIVEDTILEAADFFDCKAVDIFKKKI